MDQHTDMIARLLKLAPKEGYTLSRLDGVKFMRANRTMPRMPVLYEPCIAVVLQGQKLVYLGDQVFQYDPQQFLVLSLPLPFASESIGSAAEPMLGVWIRIDLAVVAELVLSLETPAAVAATPKLAMLSTAMDEKLSDAVMRLIAILSSPLESAVMGPAILREIYFRVLTSTQGTAIRAALLQQSQFSKIGKAIKLIQSNFCGELNISALATEAGMSVAAFHANFKALTATSPMQYLKTTRLHNARLHMLQDGMSATTAATQVGYESVSQFSREFKRFFGRTPIQEVTEMRQSLITLPAENIES